MIKRPSGLLKLLNKPVATGRRFHQRSIYSYTANKKHYLIKTKAIADYNNNFSNCLLEIEALRYVSTIKDLPSYMHIQFLEYRASYRNLFFLTTGDADDSLQKYMPEHLKRAHHPEKFLTILIQVFCVLYIFCRHNVTHGRCGVDTVLLVPFSFEKNVYYRCGSLGTFVVNTPIAVCLYDYEKCSWPENMTNVIRRESDAHTLLKDVVELLESFETVKQRREQQNPTRMDIAKMKLRQLLDESQIIVDTVADHDLRAANKQFLIKILLSDIFNHLDNVTKLAM